MNVRVGQGQKRGNACRAWSQPGPIKTLPCTSLDEALHPEVSVPWPSTRGVSLMEQQTWHLAVVWDVSALSAPEASPATSLGAEVAPLALGFLARGRGVRA